MPGTPYIVDGAQYPRFLQPHNQKHIFQNLGGLYAVLRDDIISAPARIRIYRSADGGRTWAEQDAANAPTFAGSSAVFMYGVTIYVAYQKNGTNALTLKTFDIPSLSWGADSVAGPVLGAGSHNIYGVRLSTGVRRIVYNRANDVYYSDYVFGWAPEVQISGAPGEVGSPLLPNQIFLDLNDLLHVFYFGIVFAGDYVEHHRSITAAGVLSARQDLFTVPSTTAGPVVGIPSTFGSRVALPFNKWIAGGGFAVTWHVALMYGTPAGAAAPVWTEEVVNATDPAANTGALGGNDVTVATIDAAVPTVWWNTYYTPYLTNKLLFSRNLGAGWSAPQAWYDLATENNPDPSVADQFLHDVSIGI